MYNVKNYKIQKLFSKQTVVGSLQRNKHVKVEVLKCVMLASDHQL